jgi:hypothetical protein
MFLKLDFLDEWSALLLWLCQTDLNVFMSINKPELNIHLFIFLGCMEQGQKRMPVACKVPAVKRSMEKFVFCVKALLHGASHGNSFWMGKFQS